MTEYSDCVALSNSQFFCLKYSRPYVFCCLLLFPYNYDVVISTVKLLPFRYEVKQELGVLLFDILFICDVLPHCVGRFFYCLFASAQMNRSFIFTSNFSRFSGMIALSVFMLLKSLSCVILTYWMNLFHHSFASWIDFFSKIGVLRYFLFLLIGRLKNFCSTGPFQSFLYYSKSSCLMRHVKSQRISIDRECNTLFKLIYHIK